MRKVKCVCNRYFPNILTVGKIYDVIEFTPMHQDIEDVVYIINDKGSKNSYYTRHILAWENNNVGDHIFIDITMEYRNELIDEILS